MRSGQGLPRPLEQVHQGYTTGNNGRGYTRDNAWAWKIIREIYNGIMNVVQLKYKYNVGNVWV